MIKKWNNHGQLFKKTNEIAHDSFIAIKKNQLK